jgi:L-malate glycosyltransferase
LLFAGRLVQQKGVDTLLLALARLGRTDYSCLIAGDGPERGKLENLCSSLGLQEQVLFLGERSDMNKLLRSVDFLIVPSRYEGMPLIVLEAMAAGCAILASRVDGIAENLCHESSAWLVAPDDVNELSKGLNLLMDDADLRHHLAKQARQDVESFSAERVARQIIRLYDEVLSGKEG